MRIIVLTSLALLLASAVVARAAGFGLKPGLWELHVVRQVVNGQDDTAAVNTLAARMQQMMANLPPDQRAKVQGLMKQNGIGGFSGSAVQICVSPEMARRDRPIIDPEGRCQPASINHSGNTTTFSYQCTINGEMTVGKGTAVADGDRIAVSSDLTATGSAGGPRSMHNETELRFLGSDCGDVKPAGNSALAP